MQGKKHKGEHGSVTVEATISLTSFMFAIVTILTVVNICIVQAKISNAINITAKEISQYSYLYSLTGFQKSEAELAESTEYATQNIDSIMGDINTVFNEIENLGNTGKESCVSIESISSGWESIKNIEGAGSSLYDTMEDIAKDPKQMIFGVAKLAASKSMDLAKSRLIAAPLAKVMCKKHLVNEDDGNVETYLKALGVVPDANGSYYDSLDFSKSSLFPGGSNEITINVAYDVKVITLLPIDFTFHFNQTAITHGWLAGESSFQGTSEVAKKYEDNNTLWTDATVKERTDYIRNLAFKQLKTEGYLPVTPNTSGVVFSEEANEFIMPRSMNPLWSADGEEPISVDNLDEATLKKQIEYLCADFKSNEFGDTVDVKTTDKNGNQKVVQKNSADAKYKIILTIPEDEGLKEKMETIISGCKTDGVTIELSPNYGNGAKATEVTESKEDSEE